MGKSTIPSVIPSHQGPGIVRRSFMYDSVHGSEMLQGNITSVPLSLVLKYCAKSVLCKLLSMVLKICKATLRVCLCPWC